MKSVGALGMCSFLIALLRSTAFADDIATSATVQSSAPIAISRCSVVHAATFEASFNLYNRSEHGLIDASMEYRFFDRDNAQIGQISYTYTPSDTLSPKDTGTFNNNYIFPNLDEPVSAVSRVTCRVTGAHFTGRIGWKPGGVWQGGPLAPAPKAQGSPDDASLNLNDSHGAGAHVPIARLAFNVERAWNDVAQDGIFVHDSLIIHGSDQSATIRPTDFVLTMALANGANKMYSALAQGAPTFQKYNGLTGVYTTAYEIDPQVDLGRLGSIIVPAHGQVTVTVTFAIPDAVSDAKANQAVSFR